MNRLFASWRVLALVLAAASLLLLVLARDVQHQQREQTLRELIHSAALINELAVEINLPGEPVRALQPTPRNAITRQVRHLQSEGQLVGLQLWNADGSLLYGDTEEAERLSDDEVAALAEVLAGNPQVEFEHDGNRDQPTATVLIQPENRNDQPSGVVAELLLPEGDAVSALRASSSRLYGLAGVLLVALTGFLVVLRHRMLRREHEATHDPLTGLGNRAKLRIRAAEVLGGRRSHPGSGLVALLLLDLDGFKTVNDTLGHALGDELLVQVGATLQASVRPSDLVVRLGGDEFAVLLTELPGPEVAVRVAEDLCTALHRPFLVTGVGLEVGGSIGVSLATREHDDLDRLLRRADVAMYQAKRDGGGVRQYDESDDPHDEAQLGLLAQLRPGIENEELVLHYQPKVSLREGRTVGLEALVRWQHPQHGLLYPAAFVGLAERTALMRPLTSWVLREAVRQVAVWRRAGWDVSVAVNIPPRTLLDDDLCAQVVQALADHDMPGEALELEITETAVMVDPVRAAQTLRELRTVGVAVAIDDFGAGYTSLAYLKSLPVHSLKIDRGFVTDLVNSTSDEAVTRSVVTLGHDLGLVVVAEGVETADVQQRLRELGCDEVQGYLLARPMDPDAVQPWLLERARTQQPAVRGDRPATA